LGRFISSAESTVRLVLVMVKLYSINYTLNRQASEALFGIEKHPVEIINLYNEYSDLVKVLRNQKEENLIVNLLE
jgi:hypothetical protein